MHKVLLSEAMARRFRCGHRSNLKLENLMNTRMVGAAGASFEGADLEAQLLRKQLDDAINLQLLVGSRNRPGESTAHGICLVAAR